MKRTERSMDGVLGVDDERGEGGRNGEGGEVSRRRWEI